MKPTKETTTAMSTLELILRLLNADCELFVCVLAALVKGEAEGISDCLDEITTFKTTGVTEGVILGL